MWAGAVGGPALTAAAEEVAARLRAEGALPAVIPFGGSSALGARGHASCGHELLMQDPDLDTVVSPWGPAAPRPVSCTRSPLSGFSASTAVR